MQYETEVTIVGVGTEIEDRPSHNTFSIDTDCGSWIARFGGFNPPELSRDELKKIQKTLRAFGVPQSHISFDLEGCLKYLEAERWVLEQLDRIYERPRKVALHEINYSDECSPVAVPFRNSVVLAYVPADKAVKETIDGLFSGIGKLFETAALSLVGKKALIISGGPGTQITGIKPMPDYDPATYFYDRYALTFGEFMRHEDKVLKSGN